MEEQQRFRQRAEAYKARIQHLETRLGTLQAQIDQPPTAPIPAVTAAFHSPQHPPNPAAPGSPKDAMQEGTADAEVHRPPHVSPERDPAAAEGAEPAGRLSTHSPTNSAAGPSRQVMKGAPGSGLGAPMGLQQTKADGRTSLMRQEAAILGSPQACAAGSSGDLNGLDAQQGQIADGGSPPSHLARASSHMVLDGEDEVASGVGVVHAEAAAAAACHNEEPPDGVEEPGRITAQLLAAALAQALREMPSGEPAVCHHACSMITTMEF